MIEILSLGAGVQSSTIALMSAAGELPPLAHAIFADTGEEPAGVYRWLDWLEAQLPFPVHRVRARRRLGEHDVPHVSAITGRRYMATAVPYWTQRNGVMAGALRRKCTRDYKIRLIARKARELGYVPARGKDRILAVRQWIGISRDEADRMKPARPPDDKWCVNHWPLIDLRMTRADCVRWMADHGYPEPPRSACTFCPYHSAEEWRRLQVDDPESYEAAARHEDKVRALFAEHGAGMDCEDIFVSKVDRNGAGRPLREIDWSIVVAQRIAVGQLSLDEHWGNECEGMCGV